MNIIDQFRDAFASGLEFSANLFAFLGDYRWAAGIFALTVVVNTILLPLGIKQFRSTQAMQRLQPEMKRLQQKFKSDRQKLNQEMMALYQREGVNPLGGCLPLIAQIPIFFGIFWAIQGLPDDIYMPFLGGNLADPASASPAGWILLAVMTVSQFLSTRQMATGQNPQQQRIMQLMPIVFVFILIRYEAALVLYWATQGVYRFVQQWVMIKTHELPEVDTTKKSGKSGKAIKGSGASPPKKAPKKAQSKGKRKRR